MFIRFSQKQLYSFGSETAGCVCSKRSQISWIMTKMNVAENSMSTICIWTYHRSSAVCHNDFCAFSLLMWWAAFWVPRGAPSEGYFISIEVTLIWDEGTSWDSIWPRIYNVWRGLQGLRSGDTTFYFPSCTFIQLHHCLSRTSSQVHFNSEVSP